MWMIWTIPFVNGGLVAQAERRNSSFCLPLPSVLYSSGSEFQRKRISPLESEKATSPEGNFGLTKLCRPGDMMSLAHFSPACLWWRRGGFVLDWHSYPLTHKASTVLVPVAHTEGVAHAASFPLTPGREISMNLEVKIFFPCPRAGLGSKRNKGFPYMGYLIPQINLWPWTDHQVIKSAELHHVDIHMWE